MKIKLRNMTAEQWDKWNQKNCFEAVCEKCPFISCDCCRSSWGHSWVNHKDMFSDKFLDQEVEIDEPQLTEKEKTYLENVIQPFKDKVLYIKKYFNPAHGDENINIVIDHEPSILLPKFEKNKYYENLKIDKAYTLKELGLFKDE